MFGIKLVPIGPETTVEGEEDEVEAAGGGEATPEVPASYHGYPSLRPISTVDALEFPAYSVEVTRPGALHTAT